MTQLTAVIIAFMMDKRDMESCGYTFMTILGEGMYGKVVRACSIHQNTDVAIKIIDKKRLSSTYLEMFLPRELEIIKSLNHPNIVKTLDMLKFQSGKVYVVMELCEKGNLLKHITVQKGLTEDSSCRLFTQLCAAVQYLHSIDIAHRDLKCENLLLDLFHNLKVCDFGFSKRLLYADGRLVLSETYCGTLSYAAPEMLRRLPYNPKMSDVWSMGVVLYMMLYVSMPYDATNVRRMVKSQMQHMINFPNIPSVSFKLKDLIQSILHPVVEQRFTISQILQNSWMLQKGRMEATTSNAGSEQEKSPDEKATEDEKLSMDGADPGEGPSTAAARY